MSIPKEPRQQMINIMYLVLIAMLALNVSNEIVNAFKVMDEGIVESDNAIQSKIAGTMKQFQGAVEKNPEGQKFLDVVAPVQGVVSQFKNFVTGLQDQIQDGAGREEGQAWAEKLDDQDNPTRILIKEGNADVLAAKIEETANSLSKIFDDQKYGLSDAQKASLKNKIVLKTGEIPEGCDKGSWAICTFDQMPLVAVVTLMDKFKADATNTEAAIIEQLKTNVSSEEILYDAFDVAIVPSGSKLIQGEDFKAEVFLTASSSASKPTISINGKNYTPDAGGRAEYKVKANSLGKKSINASLTFKDGFGKDQTLTKKFEYEVVPPPDHVPVVSATKMNAFYIGLPNPVSASITGVRSDKTNVSMSGGNISKESGAGNYTVTVSAPGEVNINVSGTNEQGKKLNYSVPFRAKRIPDPVPMVGKDAGGPMKSGNFQAQQGLRAVLADFLFDAKFEVKSYELTLADGGDLQIVNNNGGKYGGKARRLIEKAKPGHIFYFDKIKAKGPDGKTRKLPSIVFKII